MVYSFGLFGLVEETLDLVQLAMLCNANMVMSLYTIQHTLMEQLNLICIPMNQSLAIIFCFFHEKNVLHADLLSQAMVNRLGVQALKFP